MAKKQQQPQPKMLYQLDLIPANVVHTPFGPQYDKTVYVYCTRRSIPDVLLLYRQRHPNDKSKFMWGNELQEGPLIIE